MKHMPTFVTLMNNMNLPFSVLDLIEQIISKGQHLNSILLITQSKGLFPDYLHSAICFSKPFTLDLKLLQVINRLHCVPLHTLAVPNDWLCIPMKIVFYIMKVFVIIILCILVVCRFHACND